MIRGTDIPIEFSGFPYKDEEVEILYISFFQHNEEVIEITKDRCKIIGNSISTNITQEESLRFKENTLVEIQIRGKLKTTKAFASEIMTERVDRILKEGLI